MPRSTLTTLPTLSPAPSLMESMVQQLVANLSPQVEGDYAAFKAKYRDDPAGFVEDCFVWHSPKQGPTAYQKRALTLLSTKHRLAVRGPHGLGKCLCYNSSMRLADGSVVEAQSLIGKTFQVLAVDEDLKVHVADAFAWDNGVRDVVEIITDKGRTLTRTLNHPLWADATPYRWDKKVYSSRLRPEGKWTPAGDLQPGATVAVYLGNNSNSHEVRSDYEIKLAAYLIADGGTSTTRKVMFTQQSGPVLDEFAEICAALSCRLRQDSKYDFAVSSNEPLLRNAGGQKRNLIQELARAWGLAGKNSHQKRFPDWVWRLNNKRLAIFLSRLYACDGWAHAALRPDGKVNKEIGYTSVNMDLANDVSAALLRLGIHAEVRRKRTTWTHKGVRKSGEAWTVAVHDTAQILKFAERVGIFGKEEQVQKVVGFCQNASLKEQQKWRSFGLPDGFAWERIKSVRIIPNQPTVAITVPEYETFLTEFVEHNTSTSAWTILWFALTRDGEDWKIITTASAWRQLVSYTWPEIHKWVKKLDWQKIGRPPFVEGKELLQTALKLDTGQAFAVASNNHLYIEGAHADHLLYVFDEAKAIPSATWDAAEGAFSGASEESGLEAKALAISTPGEPAGRFYDIHSRRAGLEDWTALHVTLADAVAAGRISQKWADQRKALWGENSQLYQIRVLGEFSSHSADGVIPLAWIEKANERWQEWLAADKPGKFVTVGVDVGYGKDKSVLAKRFEQATVTDTGSPVTPYKAIDTLIYDGGADTMAVSGRTKGILDAYGGQAVVDVIGYGAGVVDRLREQGYTVTAFNAGERAEGTDKSGELGFVNKRSQAWWRLRELLDPANDEPIALPPDDLLTGDLCGPKWKVTSGGKIQIEDKPSVKERIGRSTDSADAVMMAFANEGAWWTW